MTRCEIQEKTVFLSRNTSKLHKSNYEHLNEVFWLGWPRKNRKITKKMPKRHTKHFYQIVEEKIALKIQPTHNQ